MAAFVANLRTYLLLKCIIILPITRLFYIVYRSPASFVGFRVHIPVSKRAIRTQVTFTFDESAHGKRCEVYYNILVDVTRIV